MKTPYIIIISGIALLASLTSSWATTSQDLLTRQIDEERLAYQVYTTLGEHYPNLRQFQNIPRSESRHFKALQNYTQQKYPDLETGTLEGDFIHPETQVLYDKLVEEGKANAQAALNVGVQIEQLDIRDLDEALANSPEAKLRTIYENLRAGSEKHLAAFSGNKGHGKGGNKRGQNRGQ